jgi:hypothetical protein
MAIDSGKIDVKSTIWEARIANKWGKLHDPDNTGSSADDVPMYPQDGLQGMQYTDSWPNSNYNRERDNGMILFTRKHSSTLIVVRI